MTELNSTRAAYLALQLVQSDINNSYDSEEAKLDCAGKN